MNYVLFRIGSFEVTGFGLIMALAALVGLWVLIALLALAALGGATVARRAKSVRMPFAD